MAFREDRDESTGAHTKKSTASCNQCPDQLRQRIGSRGCEFAAPSRPTMAIHLRTTETRITTALPPDAAVRRPVALIQAPNGRVDHTELTAAQGWKRTRYGGRS
jgi:hypothetical protein